MTQAEKTMLRYQYVLAQTTSAHGDYARTIRSWHNQIILLKENFKELGIIVGTGLIQAIKPFVMAMNAAFNAVLTFSTNVLNALGQIFGWEVETFARGSSLEDFADTLDDVSGGIGDTANGADDTASGLDKADKAAKKLKATVLGFDELNILNGADEDLNATVDSGSGTGSGSSGLGSGVGGLGDGGIGDIEYKLKKTDSKFKSAIDNLYDLGKYISDSLAKTLDKINWDKVYKKAENFGIGLADFLNGLVQPHTFASLGKTVGNSINAAMRALDSFAYTFNFYNLGSSIALGVKTALYSIRWKTVRNAAVSWGYGLGAYLNGLLDYEMFAAMGDTVAQLINSAVVGAISFGSVFEGSELGDSLEAFITHSISTINWDNIEKAATLLAEDAAQAINSAFDNPQTFFLIGVTISNALNTSVLSAIEFNKELNGENIGKAFGNVVNHALGGIKWENVLTEAQLLAEDISQAINAFCTPENFSAVGTTVGKGISTAIKFAFELGNGIDFAQLGESFNTFLHTTLDNINSDDVANTINTWIYGALDFLEQVDMQYIVEKIFEVMSKIDWGAAANLKLELDELDAATSIASGIASAFGTNPIKGIIGAGISGLGMFAASAVAGWGFKMGLSGTSAGLSAVGTVGGTTGLLGVFSTGLGALPGLLAAAAPPILAGILVTAGILGMSDPRVQRKIEEGKVALDKFRNDENKNWSLSYQNMSGTASDYSKQIENTVKTTNNGIKSSYDSTTSKAQTTVESANYEIKKSYDSLGREIGQVVNGDYSTSMDDMQSIGERAAEGLKNAFQSVTDFFSGLDFPTWHLEWEQHEEGGYGFSLPKIVRYASGGFPDAGLFFANEYGNPEMIGTIGNRPAVANNDQITTAIRGAVVDGMMQVFMATGGMGGNGGSPTVEVTVKADSETLYRTVRRGEQKYNRRYSVVAQM